MVGDDGNGLTVMPAVVVFGRGQGVVGVAGVVVACCACPGGLVVVGAGCAGALVSFMCFALMLVSLPRMPGEIAVARLLCVRKWAASAADPWCTT